MKKIITVVFILMTLLMSLQAQNALYDAIRQNPNAYHYLSFEEFLLNDTVNRDFIPTDPPVGNVRQTAEFEQMEGVLVVYPLGIPVSAIAELSEDTKVYTIVTTGNQNSCTNMFTNNGVNMANVEFINSNTNSYWVRDFGPWFIDRDHQIEIVDFPYNRPRPLDDEIPVVVANYLDIDYYGMSVEHTGGNYMCDGNFNGASTDLVYEENYNLTSTQIDQYFLDFLGIETYHVTPDPLDDYIKHIDCWGKFLDVDKVIIGQVPETDYRYDDFEFVANYFATQTSAWGNNYEVYRVFTPGGNPATPYTNCLIINKKVLLPVTGSQWDDEAIATYEEVMPGYEIIPVNYNGWYNTDALHCRTRGVADRNMLYVEHLPLLGEQEYQTEYLIEAEITPYSGQPVYEDSLIVYYKTDGEDFTPVQMTNVAGNQYSAVIAGQPEGTEISYYLHAADEAGKSIDHPFIGSYEPHVFTVAGGAVPAELIADPISFNLEMQQDETETAFLELKNIGGMSLNYQINEIASWLTITPVNGSVTAGDSVDVELTFDTTGLAVDAYTSDIIITFDAEETIIPVTLTVLGLGVGNDTQNLANGIQGNYPNPFNPSTTISFSLNQNAQVKLSIINTRGQIVRTLVNESKIAGQHQVVWDGRDDNGHPVASGIFFSTMDAKENGLDFTSVKKIILLK
jgi:agmatine/peptidylarginine deiminase